MMWADPNGKQLGDRATKVASLLRKLIKKISEWEATKTQTTGLCQ